MIKLLSTTILCALLIVAAGCSDQADPLPTAADDMFTTDVLAPAAARGGSGDGAVFWEVIIDIVQNTDPDGDFCQSQLDGAANSFIRENPDGTLSLHVTSMEAMITFVTADGDEYAGPGHFSVNANKLFEPGGAEQWTAIGDVSDAEGNTYRAKCQFQTNAKGEVVKHEHELK